MVFLSPAARRDVSGCQEGTQWKSVRDCSPLEILKATELGMKAVQSMGVLATRFWAPTNPGQCPTSNSWSKDIGTGLAAREGSAPWGDVLTRLRR